ncbi:hypothetical protein CGCF415_v014726 [Colletotrichum fructicola]|nr:hypothetical protein CGCF415_v014726 [Colletotrichum fructicola]KAF4924160.1 hypothetical protein CGCF245_v014626 [Colletotrichum fructicola]
MPDEAVHGGFRAFRSLPRDPVDAAAFRNPSSFKEYWRRRRTFCAQSTSFSVMEFMLAFGSVGDFIAVAKLIKDIIAALDDCRGSAKNYRDVVRELEILHRTVQQVERIYDDNTLDVHLDDLKALATSNLAQINGSLHDFRDRTQKFSPGLNEDGTKNRARDAFWKIQWKFKEHEVIKFKDEIRGHTASLSMLLGITNM